jgi:hypothetical protein
VVAVAAIIGLGFVIAMMTIGAKMMLEMSGNEGRRYRRPMMSSHQLPSSGKTSKFRKVKHQILNDMILLSSFPLLGLLPRCLRGQLGEERLRVVSQQMQTQ